MLQAEMNVSQVEDNWKVTVNLRFLKYTFEISCNALI